MSAQEAAARRLRGRVGRPRHGRLLRRSRARRRRSGRGAGEDRAAERGARPVPRARPGGADRAQPGAVDVHARRRRAEGGRADLLLLRGYTADAVGRGGPGGGLVRGRRSRLAGGRDSRHEEHGSGRRGREDPSRARCGSRLRLEPRVPLGGPRDRGLRAPGPDRDRGVRRASMATGWRRSTKASKRRSCARASLPRR